MQVDRSSPVNDIIPSPNRQHQLATTNNIATMAAPHGWNASNASYCYLDFDLDDHRCKLATAAAFVDATNSRYGFSSKDLRLLGGSEVARIPELLASDHEWAGKPVQVRPPPAGNRVVVRLFWDVAPLACENFATLCANGSPPPHAFGPGATTSNEKKAKPAPVGESGKPLTYRGSTVHRVVPKFIIQGGDVSPRLPQARCCSSRTVQDLTHFCMCLFWSPVCLWEW